MSVLHTYTVLTVGDCTLHQLHLPEGKVNTLQPREPVGGTCSTYN